MSCIHGRTDCFDPNCKIAALEAQLSALSHTHAEMLRYIIADRDALYDGCSDDTGHVHLGEDRAALARVDAIIERAYNAAEATA